MKGLTRRGWIAASAGGIVAGLPSVALGQGRNWPERPIRLVSRPKGIGRGSDAGSGKQRSHALLGLAQRRRPQLQRGLQRGSGHQALRPKPVR